MTSQPVDPNGLDEFSVVFTNRSLNHMSQQFQEVMNDISTTLKHVYGAHAVVVIPGGGTYAMEAVARQFCNKNKVLVLRNGWFSYRWTQIIEAADISNDVIVLKALQSGNEHPSPFAPQAIEDVTKRIADEKPAIVFAPHVETSSGIILPDDYIAELAKATHEAGGLFALDCIASGAVWVDMASLGVDVLISAPQKGWSASPSAGLVMLSENALKIMDETNSTSFSIDLKKWHNIMQAYENGGHAYHATMPTDALLSFRDAILETRDLGFETAKEMQFELGRKVRDLLNEFGYKSVAARGFEAPGVVVSYTTDPEIHNGKKFIADGMQIAAGVPLMCDEPEGFQTFRLGLFGLDKLKNVDKTVARLRSAIETVSMAE